MKSILDNDSRCVTLSTDQYLLIRRKLSGIDDLQVASAGPGGHLCQVFTAWPMTHFTIDSGFGECGVVRVAFNVVALLLLTDMAVIAVMIPDLYADFGVVSRRDDLG